MRVLQINVVYANGSTGYIVREIHEQLLADGYESYVCYGRGDGTGDRVYKAGSEFSMKLQSLASRITGYAYAGCPLTTPMVFDYIEKTAPDIVHLHCINGYFVNIYRLLEYLKMRKIRTVLTLHAEFMYTAGCSYSYDCEQWKTGCCKSGQACPGFNETRPKSWFFDRCKEEWKLMERAYRDFGTLTVCTVSDWLRDRALQSPFFRDKRVVTVMNGLDIASFYFVPEKAQALKSQLNIGDKKVVLHVTPNFLDPIKGGQFVRESARRMSNEPVVFIILGYAGDDKLPENAIAIPRTNDKNVLAAYYSMAEATLLTSKKETFSMICAESLCCGTSVVGFLAGAPETIAISKYSTFVEQGNIDWLIDALKSTLQTQPDRAAISCEAREKYNSAQMYKNYLSIYREMTQESHGGCL